jgi:hypothetical protein
MSATALRSASLYSIANHRTAVSPDRREPGLLTLWKLFLGVRLPKKYRGVMLRRSETMLQKQNGHRY